MVKIDGEEVDESILREIASERVYNKNGDIELDGDEKHVLKAVQQHFPDDKEKQVDMMMMMTLSMLEAEEAGSPPGQVPHDILMANAAKFNVEDAILMEIAAFKMRQLMGSLKESFMKS